jgi:hypothetical protein
MKSCQWCNQPFETKIKYQIYCSVECREEATKEKVADRYHLIRRKKMHKKTRLCKACGARLSAYNDEVLCDNCIVNPSDVTKALREMKGIANGKPSKDDK